MIYNGTPQLYVEDGIRREAPKLMRSAPSGDFAFGGTFTLESCQSVLWAGRAASKQTFIGTPCEVKFDDFILPWTSAEKTIKQSPPLDGAYNILFCVAARSMGQIESPAMLQGLDRMRVAFERYFDHVSSRCINSAI